MPFSPLSRRSFVRLGGLAAATSTLFRPRLFAGASAKAAEFDIRKYGAIGDGTTLDSPAIQRAIDAASAAGGGARVLIPGGKKFLIGTLQLRSGVEFHLADDAELWVSTRPEDYVNRAAIIANGADGLKISGTGNIHGRAREFMTGYDNAGEWWKPKEFRPRIFALTGCRDLEIRDVSFSEASSWGLHLVGCERALVDGLRIRNLLDVPNCDGIDPDHCRNVEIRNCHIVCGDDAIVIKTTRQEMSHGPSENIHVHDCTIETQDSGLKIGTETTQDIKGVHFERCKILSSSRALTIQLRDEGDVTNVQFNDIEFVSRYYSAPWWGRGEAISFTALPRNPATKVGAIRDVRVQRVTGRAENSIRVDGTFERPVQNVRFEDVDVTFDRWTKYAGRVFDNRPTTAVPSLPDHDTVGFSLGHTDDVLLRNCRVAWGKNVPDYFTYAVEAEDTKDLKIENFTGQSAHPEKMPAMKLPTA